MGGINRPNHTEHLVQIDIQRRLSLQCIIAYSCQRAEDVEPDPTRTRFFKPEPES